MKKYLGFLCAVLLVLGVVGMAGIAEATSFINEVDFDASGSYLGATYSKISDINTTGFVGNYSHVVSFNPDAATIMRWTEWTIPLTRFTDQGVNLTNVDTITLGLSSVTGGTGMMYFDDIRLYRQTP